MTTPRIFGRRRAIGRSTPRLVVALLGVVAALALALPASVLSAGPAAAATTPTITSFTTGDAYIHTGTWAYINVTVSAPIDNSTYFIRITDIDHAILKTCTTGTTCGQWVYSATAASHTYSAHLDRGLGGPAPYPIVSAPPDRTINWVTTLPTLTGGRISFHTNDEDRDHDTKVYIDVFRRDGTWVAGVMLPDSHFSDNTDNGPFSLSTAGLPSATWDQVNGGWLRIRLDAVGDDTWRFNYSTTLYFSNGATKSFYSNGNQMSDDRIFTWAIPY